MHHVHQARQDDTTNTGIGTIPPGEQRRLLLFALLGPAFITVLSTASLAAGAWLLWRVFSHHSGHPSQLIAGVMLAWMGLALAWRLLKLRPEEDAHVTLAREDAPALWRLVDELAKKLRTPRIETLRLTADFNAAAAQRPARLPLLGGPLEIHVGLPFMLTLGRDELRAVLAHEMGHVSGRHTRTSLFIWRALAQAELAREMLAGAGLAGYLAGRFYAWYVPALQRRALAFSRREEFAADAAAAAIAGQTTVARALCVMEAHAAAWNEVMRQAHQALVQGHLPERPLFQLFRTRLRAPEHERKAATWLARALRAQADDDDTHPALADRLAALGVNPATATLPPLPRTSALDTLLAPNAERLERALSQIVEAQLEEVLELSSEERRLAEQALKELRERLRGHHPGPEDASAMARLLLRLGRPRQALALLNDLEERLPRRLPPLALALRGVARLGLNDARGGHDLLEAAAHFPDVALMAAEEIGTWLDGPGAAHDTPRLRHELGRLREMHERASEELQAGPASAMLRPPRLSPAEQAWIVARLARHDDAIRAVHVAERRLRSVPAWRHLEVLVHTRPGYWLGSFNGAEKCMALAQTIAEEIGHLQRFTLTVRVMPWAGDAQSARRIRKRGQPLALHDFTTPRQDAPRRVTNR